MKLRILVLTIIAFIIFLFDTCNLAQAFKMNIESPVNWLGIFMYIRNDQIELYENYANFEEILSTLFKSISCI